MIKVVIFDLGGVLFTNGTKQFITFLSQQYNLDRELVKDVLDGDLGSQYREGKINRDTFWKQTLEKLKINVDIDRLEEQWINGYELIAGTKDIIFELNKQYKVYYLSDNVRERVEKINNRYNFLQWFEDGIFSHEVGVRKPNPEIYKYALQKINVEPHEAIFIDDKPSALAPAHEMGMKTILFESPEQVRNQLIELSVL
jgi:epoxide hydrolase-like predicted phosphatase